MHCRDLSTSASATAKLPLVPQGDVRLPLLAHTDNIKHAMGRLIFQYGMTSIYLIKESWFTVGSATFAISLEESASLGWVRKNGKHDARESPDAMLEMSSSFFLQWSLGELFDFMVPVKGRKARGEEDKHFAYQNPLYGTSALEFPSLQPASIVRLSAKITATVRLMGVELAKGLREHAYLSPSL